MKYALFLLVCAAASKQDSLVDDYVNMMMDRVESSTGVETADFDEAVSAKGHGHGPHGHRPHGHRPHRHRPHRHNPHRHNPHRHTPYPTSYPTAFPTGYPTAYPTPHPCDDGSHGCDKGTGGICYKQGGNQWGCGCKSTHWCSKGCSAPHTAHTCLVITPSPTAYPTPSPTAYPTSTPTAEPTANPTAVPTAQPTANPTTNLRNVRGLVTGVKKCCEKEVAYDSKFILPAKNCKEVRAGTNQQIYDALIHLEENRGLTDDQILHWLDSNNCLQHVDGDTHLHKAWPVVPTCKYTTCEFGDDHLMTIHHNKKEKGKHTCGEKTWGVKAGSCACLCTEEKEVMKDMVNLMPYKPSTDYPTAFPTTAPTAPKKTYPKCIPRKQSIWAMCGDVEVKRWGIDPKRGKAQSVKDCHYAAQHQKRWGSCEEPMSEITRKCNNIAVAGAGYDDINMVYTKSKQIRNGKNVWIAPNGADLYWYAGNGPNDKLRGWGIGHNGHHRYHDSKHRDTKDVPNSFWQLRTAGGTFGTRAPVPTFTCLGDNIEGASPISSKCKEITVTGAGYDDVNQVYKKSGKTRNGKSMWWAKNGAGINWYAGNGPNDKLRGWGIGHGGHHRYHDDLKRNTKNMPTGFWQLRSAGGSFSTPPLPTFKCTGGIEQEDPMADKGEKNCGTAHKAPCKTQWKVNDGCSRDTALAQPFNEKSCWPCGGNNQFACKYKYATNQGCGPDDTLAKGGDASKPNELGKHHGYNTKNPNPHPAGKCWICGGDNQPRCDNKYRGNNGCKDGHSGTHHANKCWVCTRGNVKC